MELPCLKIYLTYNAFTLQPMLGAFRQPGCQGPSAPPTPLRTSWPSGSASRSAKGPTRPSPTPRSLPCRWILSYQCKGVTCLIYQDPILYKEFHHTFFLDAGKMTNEICHMTFSRSHYWSISVLSKNQCNKIFIGLVPGANFMSQKFRGKFHW